MSMSKYLHLYIAESREHLSAIEEELSRLEQSPQDLQTLQDLFRHAHSIKGMSASMGFASVAELAHGIEDALDRVKRGGASFDSNMRSSLARAFDAVDRMLGTIAGGGNPADESAPLLQDLRRLAPDPTASSPSATAENAAPTAGLDPGLPPPRILRIEVRIDPASALPAARAAVAFKRLEGRGRIVRCAPTFEQLSRREFEGRLQLALETNDDAEAIAEDLRRLADVEAVEVSIEAVPPPGPEQAVRHQTEPGAGPPAPPETLNGRTEPAAERTPEPPTTATVRVPARSLDRFLDTIGEMIVHRSRLAALLDASGDRSARVELDRIKGLVDRLYGDLMALRMLPFEMIAHRFTRSVRELSESLGKKVALKITGREVLLDRSMLDELIDPINHTLRNAIDHGIETPEQRLAAGKPETGSIAISLERAGDSVTLRIEDDGRGIDPARIREAALRKGFINRDQAATIGDQEALLLTTIPGFSTSDRVTEVSGRGVGMDVVRTRVETLGGRLRVRSHQGAGVTIEMRLPLTIVVVKAFIVEGGGRFWAVPLTSVRRTVQVTDASQGSRGGRLYLSVDGEEIPLFDLGARLGLEAPGPASVGRREALVASDRDRSVAFTVDRILGRREIVVKPLRQPLEELRGFSGATILDDGSIALILDPLSLAPL